MDPHRRSHGKRGGGVRPVVDVPGQAAPLPVGGDHGSTGTQPPGAWPMQMRLRRTFEEVTAEIMNGPGLRSWTSSPDRGPRRGRRSVRATTHRTWTPTAGRVPRRPRGASLAPGRAKVSGTRGGAEILARSRRRNQPRGDEGGSGGRWRRRRRRLEADMAPAWRVKISSLAGRTGPRTGDG